MSQNITFGVFVLPTILLLTSSSMALTNSAALGVSELDGRTDRREDVWTIMESRRWKEGKKRALEAVNGYNLLNVFATLLRENITLLTLKVTFF